MNNSKINDESNYCCFANNRRNSDSFFANHVIDEGVKYYFIQGDVLSTTGVLL